MQKALQLINAIILRPSLSIVGLFGAMTIGYVGFAIINNLFWTVASLQSSFSIFHFIAIMSLYTTLCYKCVQAMIGVMAKIPSDILEWMAGGISREFGSSTGQDMHHMAGIQGGKDISSGAAMNAYGKYRQANRGRNGGPNGNDDQNGGDKPKRKFRLW